MSEFVLDVDPDVTRARVPGAELYQSGPHQRTLIEACFGSWQWLADRADVPAPRGALPVQLLPGSMDEPLLITREAGELACLSNVCTHRGHWICREPEVGAELRCPYHGRKFSLNGAFRSAPGFRGAADFPSDADNLASLPLHSLGPWLFTALRAGRDFANWIAPLVARIGHLPLDRAVRDPSRSRTWVMDAHWALYVENYLEGLHIPFVHPGLVRTLDFAQYRHELLEVGTLQVAVAAPGEAAFSDPLPSGHPEAGMAVAAWYFWLFPNLMVNVYPYGVSMNRVRPLAAGRTAVDFESYVFAPEHVGKGAGGDLDQVEREDEAAVESVQRGLASRLWRRGRYAPEHELGTHHFHRLLSASLTRGKG